MTWKPQVVVLHASLAAWANSVHLAIDSKGSMKSSQLLRTENILKLGRKAQEQDHPPIEKIQEDCGLGATAKNWVRIDFVTGIVGDRTCAKLSNTDKKTCEDAYAYKDCKVTDDSHTVYQTCLWNDKGRPSTSRFEADPQLKCYTSEAGEFTCSNGGINGVDEDPCAKTAGPKGSEMPATNPENLNATKNGIPDGAADTPPTTDELDEDPDEEAIEEDTSPHAHKFSDGTKSGDHASKKKSSTGAAKHVDEDDPAQTKAEEDEAAVHPDVEDPDDANPPETDPEETEAEPSTDGDTHLAGKTASLDSEATSTDAGTDPQIIDEDPDDPEPPDADVTIDGVRPNEIDAGPAADSISDTGPAADASSDTGSPSDESTAKLDSEARSDTGGNPQLADAMEANAEASADDGHVADPDETDNFDTTFSPDATARTDPGEDPDVDHAIGNGQ